jgi:hypothetical protein
MGAIGGYRGLVQREVCEARRVAEAGEVGRALCPDGVVPQDEMEVGEAPGGAAAIGMEEGVSQKNPCVDGSHWQFWL